MLKNGDHIRICSVEALIVILVVISGLLIFCNSAKNENRQKTDPISTYISVSEYNAISGQCARLQIFQKTWILNKDNCNLLAFNRNRLSENRRESLKVTLIQSIRQSYRKIPDCILRYHLFPAETDLPPLLG